MNRTLAQVKNQGAHGLRKRASGQPVRPKSNTGSLPPLQPRTRPGEWLEHSPLLTILLVLR
ncbi:hypothetical protein V0M98_04165 [Pseudomonas silesiensis]|uniref:hypothetical protein n=1 Tax=Pseudomonas silesiensis TaxID=1853130 RepID=UPI0030D35472